MFIQHGAGEDNDFVYYANEECELEDMAEELAYDNFQSFEQDPEEFGDYRSWEEVEAAMLDGELDETDYYGYTISEITEEELAKYQYIVMNHNENKEETNQN